MEMILPSDLVGDLSALAYCRKNSSVNVGADKARLRTQTKEANLYYGLDGPTVGRDPRLFGSGVSVPSRSRAPAWSPSANIEQGRIPLGGSPR
jgi:hypothetical protein